MSSTHISPFRARSVLILVADPGPGLRVFALRQVAHVACGMKWFEQLTRPTPPGSRSHRFRAFVEQQGKPRTKAFNHESRARADMDRSWYAPLEVLRRK